MLVNILEQSLLFFPLTVGVFISYGILRIPDLATDGSFILGAALFGIAVTSGLSPVSAMTFSVFGGICVGMTTSLLQTHMKINPLIAGILLVFILNSFVLIIMGKPNLSLFEHSTIFGAYSKVGVLIILSLILLGVIGSILASRFGLFLNAFGSNSTLLNLYGKNASIYKMLGLALSNGLVGYSGALSAQASGYVDIGMGTGVVLIALGTVIIGKQIYSFLFKKTPTNYFVQLQCCLLGIISYFSIVNALIYLGIDLIYLRMMIGICLIGFFALMRKNTAEVLA